jgi:hypothetical protein
MFSTPILPVRFAIQPPPSKAIFDPKKDAWPPFLSLRIELSAGTALFPKRSVTKLVET